MRAWIGCVAAAMIAACVPTPRHQCATGAECPGGLCVLGGCAHADPDCPSGAAYEDELGGACVAQGGADAAIDASGFDTAELDGPAVTVRCNGGTLEACEGDTCLLTLCSLGCLVDPAPHCGVFAPANVPDDLDAFAGVTARPSWGAAIVRIDSDDGSITSNATPSGPLVLVRGPGQGVIANIGFHLVGPTRLAVMTFSGLEIRPGSTVFVHGSRPLIVMTQLDLIVGGIIDAQRCAPPDDDDQACGGPGGGRGGAPTTAGGGCAGGGPGNVVGTSGGGASGGNLALGLAGGSSTLGPGGAPSATPCGQQDATPLVGGSGGGGSLDSSGGGGGGAIQLVSFSRLVVAGRIQAGGRGGGGATNAINGGGGGGGGGTVLLQAPAIELSGSGIAAGGGTGGCGNCAVPGDDGFLGTANAMGGGIGVSGANPGGRGGASGAPAHAGTAGSAASGGGGGGGGGPWGVIRIDSATTPTGTFSFQSPSVAQSAVNSRGAIRVR